MLGNRIYSNFIVDYLWIIILVVVLVILFSFAIFIFLWSRKRYRKQVKDLRVKHGNIHELLTADCHNMITRIEFISKKNSRYLHIYDQFEISYTNCMDVFDLPCDQAIGTLESLISEKAFKDIKVKIETARINIQDYEKNVKKLNDELSDILKEDDLCRTNSLSVKEQFRSIKESVSKNSTELKGLEDSFSLIFSEINSKLYEYEDLVDGANYEEANAIISDLKNIISALFEIMEVLPFYNTLIKAVIPERIKELTVKYEEMTNENYPLHHIHFNSTIEKINDRLKEMEGSLKNLVVSDIKEEVDSIIDTLDGFISDFQKEIEAKEKFEKERENTTDNTYGLEKNFAKLNRNLPKYEEVYIINDSYLQQINLIKDDINRMSAIKRTLDSFVHSSTKQPYSILLKKMTDLQIEMSKIEKTLNDFHTYLRSLKENTEMVFSSIEQNYLTLKETEYNVRNLHVQALNDEVSLSFEQAYEYLAQEDAVLTNIPIDVIKLLEIHNQAKNHIDAFVKEMNIQITLAKRGEESIVHGNRLRRAYSEVNKSLIIAEKSFFEADFARATNETVNVIKKVRPDIASWYFFIEHIMN